MDLVLEANQRIPLGFLQKASDHIHCGCHSGWDAVLCIDDPVLSVVNTHPEKPNHIFVPTGKFTAQIQQFLVYCLANGFGLEYTSGLGLYTELIHCAGSIIVP